MDQLLDPGASLTGSSDDAGFVHQDDLGLHRQGAGDAQALLLTPGERCTAASSEAVAHFVPQGGLM